MSGIFDMLWGIFCLLWMLSAFKAFRSMKSKTKGKGSLLEKAAVGLIGKDVFEEIKREMNKEQPEKSKVSHFKPLQYKKEIKPQKDCAAPTQPLKEKKKEAEETIKAAPIEKHGKFQPNSGFSLNEVRRGIIMAEILGPPKAKNNLRKA